MNACVTANRVDDARKVFRDMQAAGFRAELPCYNVLLKGYSLRQDIPAVLSTLDELKASRLKPNAVTYNTVLNGLAQSGHLPQVWRCPSLIDGTCKLASPSVYPQASCNALLSSESDHEWLDCSQHTAVFAD